jgi:hypothetical protein
VQNTDAPSITTTCPVGAPEPGAVTAIATVTVTVSPTSEGSGVCALIEIVVSAGFTVWLDVPCDAPNTSVPA